MSVGYTGVQWNRQKKRYDLALLAGLLLGLGAFVVIGLLTRPEITAETLVIRATAILAFLLLHLILCIGPLARLDRRFLPVLYNRRHLGVAMFLLAAVHAVFATIQFHALGGVNPLVSVLTAYRRDFDPFLAPGPNLPHFPFEPFGVLALFVLFLMAATSHDFWLKTLGASSWKALHLLVFVAYGSLVVHVAFGALQAERSLVYPILLGAGFTIVVGLHLVAAHRELRIDRRAAEAVGEGFQRALPLAQLEEGRGRSVVIGSQRVAVFLHEGRVHATSNACRHQGGPLGEGRILDGCITCPWHGWQYRPTDGVSPPPFEEVVDTYRVRVVDGEVFVHPHALPEGSHSPGACATDAAVAVSTSPAEDAP